MTESIKKLARLIVSATADSNILSQDETDKLVDSISGKIIERHSRPIFPSPNESVAIAMGKRKSAALFFDRVWSLPIFKNNPPDNIMVYGATDGEIWSSTIALLASEGLVDKDRLFMAVKNEGVFDPFAEKPVANSIADILFATHRITAVPMYGSTSDRDREYQIGDTPAIVCAVENLGIVDEDKLTWDQVTDFREDADAKIKLRRLRHWLDSEFVGKSESFITDEIATRLENYEWALKKHGIETITGCVSELLDPKFLPAALVATAGAAMVGGSVLAAAGAAGLVIGKATISLTQRMVDLKDRKRGKDSEIAFVHELKKLSKE